MAAAIRKGTKREAPFWCVWLDSFPQSYDPGRSHNSISRTTILAVSSRTAGRGNKLKK